MGSAEEVQERMGSIVDVQPEIVLKVPDSSLASCMHVSSIPL